MQYILKLNENVYDLECSNGFGKPNVKQMETVFHKTFKSFHLVKRSTELEATQEGIEGESPWCWCPMVDGFEKFLIIELKASKCTVFMKYKAVWNDYHKSHSTCDTDEFHSTWKTLKTLLISVITTSEDSKVLSIMAFGILMTWWSLCSTITIYTWLGFLRLILKQVPIFKCDCFEGNR